MKTGIFVAQAERDRVFVAWKPVSGARATGRIKIAETSVPGIDISISSILVVKLSFWKFVMCKVETSENMEGIIPGALINRSKKNLLKRFDLSSKHGHHRFLEPDK